MPGACRGICDFDARAGSGSDRRLGAAFCPPGEKESARRSARGVFLVGEDRRNFPSLQQHRPEIEPAGQPRTPAGIISVDAAPRESRPASQAHHEASARRAGSSRRSSCAEGNLGCRSVSASSKAARSCYHADKQSQKYTGVEHLNTANALTGSQLLVSVAAPYCAKSNPDLKRSWGE